MSDLDKLLEWTKEIGYEGYDEKKCNGYESLKGKIEKQQKVIDEIKTRWNFINVDIEAPEDCVKMCISLKEILAQLDE